MLYILIVIISAVAQFFSPWWVVAPIAFALCFWKAESAKQAFLVSLAAISTVWIVYALFLNFTGASELAGKIGTLFLGNVPILSKIPQTVALIGLMTLLIGNVGGLSGLAGYHLKGLFKA